MKNILLLLITGICFFACQENETNSTATSEQPNSSIVEENETKPASKTTAVLPSLIIDSFKDDMGNSKSKISLDMDGKKIEVTDEPVIACKKIAAADYGKFQIPAEAIDACGGSGPGGGNYYYIIRNDKSTYWMVMQALIEESQMDNKSYDYQSVMNITYVLK